MRHQALEARDGPVRPGPLTPRHKVGGPRLGFGEIPFPAAAPQRTPGSALAPESWEATGARWFSRFRIVGAGAVWLGRGGKPDDSVRVRRCSGDAEQLHGTCDSRNKPARGKASVRCALRGTMVLEARRRRVTEARVLVWRSSHPERRTAAGHNKSGRALPRAR